MRDVRRSLCAATGAVALVVAALAVPATAGAGVTVAGGNTEYLVLLESGANRAQAVDAVKAAGGEVVKENVNLGTLTVRAAATGFVSRVSASPAVQGAAP